jgi:hypothetical protein
MVTTLIVIGILAILVIWVISVQRNLISKEELCKNAMSQIGVQMSSRWDALTALADLIKSYDEHEYKSLKDVIAQRTSITGSSSAADANIQETILSDDLSPEYQMPATILNRGEGGKHLLMLLYFMFAQDCSLPVYPVEYRNTLIPAWIEEDKVLFCINVFNKGEMFFLPEEELVRREYGFVPYAYLKALHSLFLKEGDSLRVALLERILPNYQTLANS